MGVVMIRSIPQLISRRNPTDAAIGPVVVQGKIRARSPRCNHAPQIIGTSTARNGLASTIIDYREIAVQPRADVES